MAAQLSEYQVEARDFLLSGLFRCLFDEPGVGKTFPAIAAGWRLVSKAEAPVLVTCPAYLISNWEHEIHRLYPLAKVVRADGAGVQARRLALSQDADFVLTSYNNWSAKTKGQYVYRDLVDQKWAAYIFDEGHRLRGHKSSTTKHVFRTRLVSSPNRSTPIWVLTGTPFVRDGGDFFPHFKLYDSKQYGSYWTFVEDRCVLDKNPWTTNVGNIRKSYVDEFNRELAQFSLRRTVAEIPELQDLESVDHHYFVDMPASVLTMIRKAKKEYILEHPDMDTAYLGGSGALYVSQRKLATVPPTKAQPKIEWLQDFLQDHDERVVVYTWFKSSAASVADAVRHSGRETRLVTGDMAPERRADQVHWWSAQGNSPVLVATISALKEGISLTAARHVVFLEHSELPADVEQCTKRLLRRGQQQLVEVHHVHANGTVDIPIKKVLESRNLGLTEALKKWIEE